LNSPDTLKALVDSLRFDPFYVAISQDFGGDEVRRREALARYFDCSMSEGERRGRLVVWADPSVGAAVWLLPAASSVSDAESDAKAAFLTEVLGANGAENYHRIIAFMRPRALAGIDQSAWYLSIVGVAPAAQGRGIGARLIEPRSQKLMKLAPTAISKLLISATRAFTSGSDFLPSHLT